jgi:hypothetical protein
MRAVIIILFVVFISAGFLLSENIHMRKDLDEIIIRNNQLREENKFLQAEVSEIGEKLAASERLIIEIEGKNLALEEHVLELNKEISELQAENEDLTKTITNLKVIELFQQTRPNSLHLAYLLPIFPTSVAITYFLMRKRNKQDYKANPNKTDRRRMEVQLTKDEVQRLIRSRRNT